ncbi:hypothetical protein PR202_gb08434 [Eleusine coracana subsp. coracana]|uniref:Terpene synthase metal-binding domain-containing protein n=1 Tax=Eleusine coracana subsp. coracana TaxID=191504 RepID=A0AAV5EEL8_ELECO|nr:hypothetical protein PR202_gb08434 [Eleusine coracana subsp. coracana]
MWRRRHAVLCCRQTHQHPTEADRDEVIDDRLGRNIAGFHPSIWGDFFLHYSNPIASSPQLQVKMTERADTLKEEVVAMIDGSSTWSLLERLHLIHVLQRLCLDYLFDDAINGLLTQIKHADVTACDLQTVALWFYLLRYHGHTVSPAPSSTRTESHYKTIDWVRAYNTEVEWRDRRYIPATVEEHLQLSVRTGACHLLSCASFVGMDDIATEESFHWVTSMPKIVHSLCIILRLLDDLQSYEREQRMLHIASTIDSCMKEHNLSINMARKKIRELVDEEWKVLNGQWLKPKKDQPKELLERIFNLARTMEFFYEQDDAYTNSYIVKDIINLSFVDFFTLN